MTPSGTPSWKPDLSQLGTLGWARLGAGLLQGALLYWLYRADRHGVWPATQPVLFEPVLLFALFVPLIAISGLGNLRRRTLGLWLAAASLVLIGLGLHDALREQYAGGNAKPSVSLLVFSAAGLFIAHALVTGGDQDRRWIASYARYFDSAWKHIIQVALAAAFVGVFWLLYHLAAGLFALIGIKTLEELADRAWFTIPLSAMVTAFALHITDVNAGIVRGLRNLGLTLLSWLLIMMTGLIVAFLCALPFTGLAPLWAQKSATSLLLMTAASLVVLVNAAYQDGAPDHPLPRLMRYAGLAAVAALTPLTILAGYGLWLRIAPYGLTPDRIIATACTLVAAAYALGYALSLRKPGAWLSSLSRTNLYVSWLILALLIALFTPIADPARLSVNDQVARLDAGRITPDKFDYDFLRFNSGRYGRKALDRLAARKEGPNAAIIAQNAKAAQARKYAYETPRAGLKPLQLAQQITVYPAGTKLPESFFNQDWSDTSRGWWAPACFLNIELHCEAILLDVDGDGISEVLVREVGMSTTTVLKAAGDGHWASIGTISFPSRNCGTLDDAFKAGAAKAVPSTLRDIELAGGHFHIEAMPQACPGKG